MNLTAILKKIAAGEAISAEEKAFVLANKELLDDAQVAAAEKADVSEEEAEDEEEEVEEEAAEDEEVEEDEAEEEEELDEKSLEAVLAKRLEKRLDKISDRLAEKFLDGVSKQRARVIKGKSNKVQTDKEEVTRNFMKAVFSGDKEYLKNLATEPDSAGGYLVPPELRAEILRIAENQYGIARRDMRYLPFTGPGNERRIPTLDSSVTVTWTDEGAPKTSTEPAFNIVTQTLKKLAAIVPMTEEILEDSSINLTALVAELFAEAVAKEEDEQFLNGTGTPWTGVINNGNVNAVYLGSTDVADIQAEDLLAMVDATPSGALDGASFYMHRSVFSKVRTIREGQAGDGAFIVQQPTDASAPPSIWGYPIVVSEALPTVSEVTGNDDAPFIMFGNLRRAAIFGDKQQLRVKMLDQATVGQVGGGGSINLAQQDMVAIRIVERVGYVLALPQAITVLKTGQGS